MCRYGFINCVINNLKFMTAMAYRLFLKNSAGHRTCLKVKSIIWIFTYFKKCFFHTVKQSGMSWGYNSMYRLWQMKNMPKSVLHTPVHWRVNAHYVITNDKGRLVISIQQTVGKMMSEVNIWLQAFFLPDTPLTYAKHL